MNVPARSRCEIAELAWRRYQTIVEEGRLTEHDAFVETVIDLLETQDEVWLERLPVSEQPQ